MEEKQKQTGMLISLHIDSFFLNIIIIITTTSTTTTTTTTTMPMGYSLLQ